MDTQIKLYMPKAYPAKDELITRLSGSVDVSGSFTYETAWGAAKSASEAAKAGEVAVIAADESMFCSVKMCVFKALASNILRSSKLKKKIGNSIPTDSQDYNVQTALPKGAKVFVSFDGLYSAFSCATETGKLILIPAENMRLDEAIELGVFASDEEAPVQSGLSPKENLRRNIAAVKANGKTVTVASVGLSAQLMEVISSVGGDGNTFRTAQVSEEGEKTDSYYAEIARQAKENGDSDFGAVISDVGEDGTVTVCVADSESAKVEVLHSVEGENKKQLLIDSVLTICEMMGGASAEGINAPKEKSSNVSKLPLIISIACLALAVIICLVIGVLKFKDKKADEAVSQTSATEAYSDTDYYGNEDDWISSPGEVSPMHADAYDPFLSAVDSLETTVIETISTTAEYAKTTYITGDNRTAAGDGHTTVSSEEDESETEEPVTEASTETADALTVTTVERIETDLNGQTVAATSFVPSTFNPPTTTAPTGKFVFTVYGWGHGVGMSQLGAKTMARNGSSCNEILGHYYPGTVITVDPDTPMYVEEPDEDGNGGMTLLEYLCKTTKQEIGDTAPLEALKAQAVAAYTYARFNNTYSGGQTIDYDFQYKGTNVEKAVMDVLGITSEDQWPHCRCVTYNGNYCDTVYCNSMAGKTASAKSVWGMNLSYLSGGVSSPEEVEVSTFEIPADEMRSLIYSFASSQGRSTEFDKNPSKWIRIISHDGSMNEGIGYVNEVKVAGISVNGETFRTKVMKYKIRSHCFTVQYVK